ncbi:hypothetical protein WAI453_006861 [Rhynchosporium graminicola]
MGKEVNQYLGMLSRRPRQATQRANRIPPICDLGTIYGETKEIVGKNRKGDYSSAETWTSTGADALATTLRLSCTPRDIYESFPKAQIEIIEKVEDRMITKECEI